MMHIKHLVDCHRLLYGKMKRWTGTGTGGKAGVGTRRSVVLRFLASCPQHEMQIFMDLILAPFKHLYTGEYVITLTSTTSWQRKRKLSKFFFDV